jgi:RNA polymerase sigma factor (sigma-70 family)
MADRSAEDEEDGEVRAIGSSFGRVRGRFASPTDVQRIGEWLDSPYLGRVAARVAQRYGVAAQDVPDLLQELRLALWKAESSQLVSIGWVFQTANHKAIDWLKRRRRRAEVGLDAHALPERVCSPDPALRCLLHSQTSRLPYTLRRFYALRYEQGLSQREMARALGLGRSSVRSLDRRCRRLIGVPRPPARRYEEIAGTRAPSQEQNSIGSEASGVELPPAGSPRDRSEPDAEAVGGGQGEFADGAVAHPAH